MNDLLELEVFRAGDYGPKGRYSAADLDAICADYDPALHEAPVTVDHAQSGPAFGWTYSLARRGDVLVATIKDLSDAFKDLIRAGAFKKRSVEIYRQFKATGRPYLRAVSFLGACPPEVKGLADPCFADGDNESASAELYDFAERESDEGNSAAAVEAPAAMATTAGQGMADAIATLSEREAALTREIAAMADRARRDAVERFCRRAMDEGRIVPAWRRAGIVQFMLSLDDAHATIAPQGMDDATGAAVRANDCDAAPAARTPFAWFQDFINALPAIAPMREFAPERTSLMGAAFHGGGARLPLPGSATPVSQRSIGLHHRAISFQETHPGASYAEALRDAGSEQ